MTSLGRRRPFLGLSGFPITPADEAGRVDAVVLARLCARLCEGGVDAVGVLGSTGTYAYLSSAERRRAVAAAVEAVGGRLPVIVGVGALRTDDAAALARDARDEGADALLLAPVSYTPLIEDEVFEHFRTVAAATDLPLAIYNNPTTTKFSFSTELLARLSRIETIVAVKMPLPSDGDFAAELAKLRAETDLAIGYSGDWGLADAMLAGADAFYGVLPGILPGPVVALARMARDGDVEGAKALDRKLVPLWQAFRSYGSLRVVYVLAELRGLGTVVPPRPLLPLGAAAREEIAAALARFTDC